MLDDSRTPERRAISNATYARRLKLEVLAGYGGKCICCGETHPAFLTVDHINNDGAEHRTQKSTWQWWPKSIQVGSAKQLSTSATDYVLQL